MVINLTKSVPLKELCRISAYGYTTKIAHDMEFTFSHEAMVGFATELLWMYEDINENRKLSLCTHPLQSVPNQVIGFYLTPDSPVLLFKVNSLNGVEEGGEYKSWKEIYIKTKNINQYYEVREPLNEADGCISVELYEFRRKNIVNIAIFDEEKHDITKFYDSVVFEVNYNGLKELATMLLVWSNNAKEGDRYLLYHIGQTGNGYNLGIVLTRESVPTIFKCDDLGCVYDYDERI